ncbi:MAG: hypothetical protein MZW92_17575 [Comamonadaceae bacterium]|nr:hypothetical protein [Comamonadaceae bacterium]
MLVAAEQTAENWAIGAGCRHAGRSIEDWHAQRPRPQGRRVRRLGGNERLHGVEQDRRHRPVPIAQAPAAVGSQPAPVPQVKAESVKSKAATAEAPAATLQGSQLADAQRRSRRRG